MCFFFLFPLTFHSSLLKSVLLSFSVLFMWANLQQYSCEVSVVFHGWERCDGATLPSATPSVSHKSATIKYVTLSLKWTAPRGAFVFSYLNRISLEKIKVLITFILWCVTTTSQRDWISVHVFLRCLCFRAEWRRDNTVLGGNQAS